MISALIGAVLPKIQGAFNLIMIAGVAALYAGSIGWVIWETRYQAGYWRGHGEGQAAVMQMWRDAEAEIARRQIETHQQEESRREDIYSRPDSSQSDLLERMYRNEF